MIPWQRISAHSKFYFWKNSFFRIVSNSTAYLNLKCFASTLESSFFAKVITLCLETCTVGWREIINSETAFFRLVDILNNLVSIVEQPWKTHVLIRKVTVCLNLEIDLRTWYWETKVVLIHLVRTRPFKRPTSSELFKVWVFFSIWYFFTL